MERKQDVPRQTQLQRKKKNIGGHKYLICLLPAPREGKEMKKESDSLTLSSSSIPVVCVLSFVRFVTSGISQKAIEVATTSLLEKILASSELDFVPFITFSEVCEW